MWKNMVQPGRQQATIQCTCFACWITKSTDTHSEYVSLVAFLQQQWFGKRASTLHCLSCYKWLYFTTVSVKKAINTCMALINPYLLTPRSRVLLEKITSKLVKKFPAFMEPESPSPYPQVPTTCPYPEPTPSSPHDPLQLPEDPS